MSTATMATDAGARTPAIAGPAELAKAPAPAPEARARLIPLLEPATRPLTTDQPLGPPPVAGSAKALARGTGTGDSPPLRPSRASGSVENAALPDPTQLCCAMVQAAVEALRGARPLAQLARWVSPEIYEELAMRSELTQRVQGRANSAHRAGIRRIRLCRLGQNAAEATVVVNDGPRVRAVAVRLEGHRGQWRATALVIG